jgi:septum formation protein
MGLAFKIVAPEVDNEESYISIDHIEESIQKLAQAKAESVAIRFPSSLILGSDTIVVIDKQVIGKPIRREDARLMLQRLSGKKHTVYSGVALYCAKLPFSETAVANTDVSFREVEEWEIDEYLDHNEYADKAGAYAIQGRAMTFIEKIDGCFYNVMGLPVSKTIELFNAYIEFLKGRQ